MCNRLCVHIDKRLDYQCDLKSTLCSRPTKVAVLVYDPRLVQGAQELRKGEYIR